MDIFNSSLLTDAVGVFVPHIGYTFVPDTLPLTISILIIAEQSLVIYSNAQCRICLFFEVLRTVIVCGVELKLENLNELPFSEVTRQKKMQQNTIQQKIDML